MRSQADRACSLPVSVKSNERNVVPPSCIVNDMSLRERPLKKKLCVIFCARVEWAAKIFSVKRL